MAIPSFEGLGQKPSAPGKARLTGTAAEACRELDKSKQAVGAIKTAFAGKPKKNVYRKEYEEKEQPKAAPKEFVDEKSEGKRGVVV